jgi:outer membrane protein TolC
MDRRRSFFVRALSSAALGSLLVAGCNRNPTAVSYLGDPEQDYYRQHATEIDFPNVCNANPETVTGSEPPHTIDDKEKWEPYEISLMEAMHIGLQNNDIIRTAGQFLISGNGLFTQGERVPSVYDPAIQETGVLFGGRGVEAALAEFDANFTTTALWGRNDSFSNAPGIGTFSQETAGVDMSLSKAFAHGGIVGLTHNVDYLGSSIPGQTFPSYYSGNVGLNYQLPLLAGAGTEFTRIAGPIAKSFGGISGVSQGVVIARINQDIALADFDLNIRVLTQDIENAYWDLYLAYRNFDTAVIANRSALVTWRIANTQFREGAVNRADAAQARDQLFATKTASDNARSAIYSRETALRRLIGLPVNDGRILRPADMPVTVKLVPDWYSSLNDALTYRVELRRQKWNVKSLELQLRAANSLTRPRLDALAGYQVNGYGDDLLAYNGSSNLYSSISGNNLTGWNLGAQFNMPLGFRSAHAQVRNYEIRLAKAHQLLKVQEEEVSQELAAAFQELTRSYNAAKQNLNRLIAAEENVKFLEPRLLEEILFDEFLRAQLRRADAQVAYYASLVDYNKSLVNLQYRKGTILEYNNIRLVEGPWNSEAYLDAERQHMDRAYGVDVSDKLISLPEEFATPAPTANVQFTAPGAAALSNPTPAFEGEMMPPIEPAPAPGPDPIAPKPAKKAEE